MTLYLSLFLFLIAATASLFYFLVTSHRNRRRKPSSGIVRRQPKLKEADHYKLLNDFDALLEDATHGRYQQVPNGVVVPPPEYTEENTGPVGGTTTRAAALRSSSSQQASPQLWNRSGLTSGASPSASQFDSSFFRSGNFSALQGFGGGRAAGTPNSRASSSASSAISAEGRLGSALVPPSRLEPLSQSQRDALGAPHNTGDYDVSSGTALFVKSEQLPVKAHRGLLGLLTSKLRRQPAEHLSPRPHSVPVDIEEYQRSSHAPSSETLIIHGDDEQGDGLTSSSLASSAQYVKRAQNPHVKVRPATTGDTDVTPRASVGAPLSSLRRSTDIFGNDDVLVDQKSAIDKEMEEIQKLQAQRDIERIRREEERAERRKKRDMEQQEVVAAPKQPLEAAPPPQPERTIDDERQSLLELIHQDFLLLLETQLAAHEALQMQERKQFRDILRDEAFSKEEITITEEAEHQRRVQLIRERSRLDDKYREEREKQRRWEIVRDTVVDEEQARDELEQMQLQLWDDRVKSFYRRMDDPIMDTQVEERLMRCEHFETLEEEAFQAIEQDWLLDLERLFRRRIDRTWISLTASHLTVPIMMCNRFCAVSIAEQQQRRQILVAHEITHGVMWESFCDAIHPLVDRALWKLAMRETDERVRFEREEQEDSVGVFHGCKSSRELVTRYAAVVRETSLRRAQQREEALEDILEDELAERILTQRDEREGFILFEEMWRRGIDAIRANLKRIQIQQSMEAAEQLRRAEVQRALIEEERQKTARDATNQKRTSATRTPVTGSNTKTRDRTPPPASTSKQPGPTRR
ncbi:membrane-associated protein, putative [Bodo saltans]|uniref:Membrane-associated protein, putative n=1 Tax=Bodo saltans TaxID=75058 RepID=A0A0S4J5N1_BODSA|nr:membrane-associated protein, putative [Bodo saltans]|eukprot:CUG84155.1 membrane-associated protein, putative [Bodo saltans]